jgi:hypothetical protein
MTYVDHLFLPLQNQVLHHVLPSFFDLVYLHLKTNEIDINFMKLEFTQELTFLVFLEIVFSLTKNDILMIILKKF